MSGNKKEINHLGKFYLMQFHLFHESWGLHVTICFSKKISWSIDFLSFQKKEKIK